jgi:16S rRNA (cytosine967-C5)-methyltransferase
VVTQSISKARRLALEAIRRIEKDGAYLHIAVDSIQNRESLSPQDRALLSELVHGAIRWQFRYDWIIDSWIKRAHKLPPDVRWILWMGFYQIEFLSRIPDFAVVNDSVELAKRKNLGRLSGLVNAILRRFIREGKTGPVIDPAPDDSQSLAIESSHPEWLISRWLSLWGQEFTRDLCQANNQPAPLSFRCNPLRGSADEVVRGLEVQEIPVTKSPIPGFYQTQRLSLPLSQLLEQGKVTIQDGSAGVAGLAVDPQPNNVIIDLCAAPGGKSTHLVEGSGDQGLVISQDLYLSRLNRVRESRDRLQLNTPFLVQGDAEQPPFRYADRVLLDAPCSGFGVIRRKPDLKWRRTFVDVKQLADLQYILLVKASQLLKAGGILVYSTCTVEPLENEDVISRFLKSDSTFGLAPWPDIIPEHLKTSEGFVRTWPHRDQLDGGFVARLQKENGTAP